MFSGWAHPTSSPWGSAFSCCSFTPFFAATTTSARSLPCSPHHPTLPTTRPSSAQVCAQASSPLRASIRCSGGEKIGRARKAPECFSPDDSGGGSKEVVQHGGNAETSGRRLRHLPVNLLDAFNDRDVAALLLLGHGHRAHVICGGHPVRVRYNDGTK